MMPVSPDLSDGDLAAMALAGREDAYRRLLNRHRDYLFRLLRNVVGDADAALDISQEAFIAAFAALRSYDGNRPFRFWLSRIALNKARDWARRRKVRAFFTRAVGLDHAANIADPDAHPDTVAADKAELAQVMGAILQLPQNLREVLILRTVEELSEAETANVLGINAKAVETRLYRARKQLSAIRDTA
mgnify:CR=1 FL=1|jgi:RNA polymerase sigma factor (sigma-70 family)